MLLGSSAVCFFLSFFRVYWIYVHIYKKRNALINQKPKFRSIFFRSAEVSLTDLGTKTANSMLMKSLSRHGFALFCFVSFEF